MAKERDHPLYPGGESPGVVCLVGDLHGNSMRGRLAIERAAGFTPLLIQLGDFGWWGRGRDGERYISQLNRHLGYYDMTMLWLSGNHESYSSLYEIQIDEATGLRKITNRIWHIERGYRWTWDDKTWLALGGAVSVDQLTRREGVSWWPQEAITDEDVDRAIRGGTVDVLLTHDAPSGIPTIDAMESKSAHQWPARVLVDAAANRDRLRTVVDAVQPNRLFHGHWHTFYSDRLVLDADGPAPRVVRVNGLASDMEHWMNNVTLVDTSGDQIPWPGDLGSRR